jgi:hypothetical protein
MAGSSPIFYHRHNLIRIHAMIPGFLIWSTFWRSQRSKFKTAPIWARFITIWPRTYSNLVSRHHLHFYRISARSDFKYGRWAWGSKYSMHLRFGTFMTIMILVNVYLLNEIYLQRRFGELFVKKEAWIGLWRDLLTWECCFYMTKTSGRFTKYFYVV